MQDDLLHLQGLWNITSLEVDGAALPPGSFTGAGIEVKGDRFVSMGMGAAYGGSITVNAGAKPRKLSLQFIEGPETGNINNGIYELDGDHWRICLATTSGPAPVRFATSPGSGFALETLERGTAQAPEIASQGAITEIEGEWQMVSCIRNGDALDETMVKTGRRVTRGSQTSVSFGDQLFLQASFTVDASQYPKTIDLANTRGPAAGKTQLGIYELEGEVMKICYAGPRTPRPADYSATKGDGRTVAVWKRTRSKP
jgi:uncharacterized protein (TIGR03067 family)